MHGIARRRGRTRLLHAAGRRGRARGHDARRPGARWCAARGAAGVRRHAGRPVRLLLERHGDDRRSAAAQPPPAERRAGARGAVAQPVPLRHAPRDSGGGAARRRTAQVTARAASWRTRRQFREADGVLLVLRDPPPAAPPAPGQPPTVPANPAEGSEVLLAFTDDGHAVALGGHVDLGTGLQTAYAQLVAEELDLPLDRVTVILGDTARAPNQGPTIASTSIQLH